MILLKNVIALLQQLLYQFLVPAAHGEVQRSGLVGFRLDFKQLCKLRTVKDIQKCSADGLEQLMAELRRQFYNYLPLGCLLPKPHKFEQYLIAILLLVVLLNNLLDEYGEMRLGLQHSPPRPDMDEILEDIIGAVSAACSETAEVHLLIHRNRIIILPQLKEIQGFGFASFQGCLKQQAGVVSQRGVVYLIVEVSEVVQEETIASEDGSCCLRGQHTLCALLLVFGLLQSNAEEAVEVAVTAVFLPTVVYLIQYAAFKLQEILSVVLEPIAALIGNRIEQVLHPIQGHKLQIPQFPHLGSDQLHRIVPCQDVTRGSKRRDERELVVGQVDKSELFAGVHCVMWQLDDLVVVQHQLLQRRQGLEGQLGDGFDAVEGEVQLLDAGQSGALFDLRRNFGEVAAGVTTGVDAGSVDHRPPDDPSLWLIVARGVGKTELIVFVLGLLEVIWV